LIPATVSIWPDSPTAFCSNGSLATACSNALGAAFGQDGNYQGPSNRYMKANGIVSDSLLGLEWQSAFSEQPETFANATTYCNNNMLGGRDDWRIPTRLEILSTLDYGRPDPVFDTAFFDAPTGVFRGLWTRNQHASSGVDHWIVHAEGTLLARADILATLVRCVRGPVFATMLAEVGGCSIIHDSVTGLDWQKYASGQVVGWTGALQHCETSEQDGFYDWRLPSVKELETIVNPSMLNPAVDSNLFPGTPVELFWTSTPYVDNPAIAWAVDFWDGAAVHNQPTSNPLRVRCVRGGSTALR
jgi:hypothetical protein